MELDSFHFGKRGFLIKKLTKDIDVSESGHGTANYEVKLVRKNMKARFIEHHIGCEENVPAGVRMESLKKASKEWERSEELHLLRGYGFVVEPIAPSCGKLYWRELKPQRGARRFEIDLQKSYGRTEEVGYGYGWTFPKMFAGVSSKGELSSSVCIRYPTELLTLRISFPWRYPLKRGPKLEAYDFNGNKRSITCNYERENLFEDMFDMRFMHGLGSYYRVIVKNPPQGYIFKTVWRIQKP